MNANAIRTALVALLIAGGLLTACRLTASAAAPAAAEAAPAPASTICRLGSSC